MIKSKKELRELLVEGYKKTAEESLKICKEWEMTDNTLDWEWGD